MCNINAPQGRIPCAIFTKFAEFVPHFRMRWVLKFGWICSRGYGVMGVLSWGGQFSPKFSAPPSGETTRQTTKRGERTCSRSSITMPSLVGLGFHPPPGWPKTLSFLSVCLSVTLLSVRVVRPILPWRRWSTETILMPFGRGRFVLVHPCSTLSDCCQLVTTLNAEVQKNRKNWQNSGFFAARGRQNKRSRRNMARKRRPWVCYRARQLCKNISMLFLFPVKRDLLFTNI